MVDPCMLLGATTYGACTVISCVKGKKKNLASCKPAIRSKKKACKASSVIPLSDEHTKVLYFMRDSYRPRNVINVYDENKTKIYSFEKTQCIEPGNKVCIPPLNLVNKKRESMVPWDLVNVNQRRIIARLGIKKAKSWVEFMPHNDISKSKGCYSSNTTIVKSQKAMLLSGFCPSKYQTFLKSRDDEGKVCGRYEWSKLSMNLDWITPTNNPIVECRRRVAIARKLSSKNFKCLTKVLNCVKDKIPTCTENSDDSKNVIDYEITYDSTLIPRELLVTTAFISIMTQWRRLKQTKLLVNKAGGPKIGKTKLIKRKVMMKTKHILHMGMATSEMKTNMALMKSRKAKGLMLKLLGKTAPPTINNPKGDPLMNTCKDINPCEPICNDSESNVKKNKQIIGPCGSLLCGNGVNNTFFKSDLNCNDTNCSTIPKSCTVGGCDANNKGGSSNNNNNGGITIINNPLPSQAGICAKGGQYTNSTIPDIRNCNSFGSQQGDTYFDFDNISPLLITEEEIVSSPFYIDDDVDISSLYDDCFWDQNLTHSGTFRSNNSTYIEPKCEQVKYHDTPIQYSDTRFDPYQQEHVKYYPSEEYRYCENNIMFQGLPCISASRKSNKGPSSNSRLSSKCATRTPTPASSPSYIYDNDTCGDPSASSMFVYEPISSKSNYYQTSEKHVTDDYSVGRLFFDTKKNKKRENKSRDYETMKNTKFNSKRKFSCVGSDLLKKSCLSAPCLVESVCSSPSLIKNKIKPLSLLCSHSDGKSPRRKQVKCSGNIIGSADFPTSRGRDVNRGYYS